MTALSRIHKLWIKRRSFKISNHCIDGNTLGSRGRGIYPYFVRSRGSPFPEFEEHRRVCSVNYIPDHEFLFFSRWSSQGNTERNIEGWWGVRLISRSELCNFYIERVEGDWKLLVGYAAAATLALDALGLASRDLCSFYGIDVRLRAIGNWTMFYTSVFVNWMYTVGYHREYQSEQQYAQIHHFPAYYDISSDCCANINYYECCFYFEFR